MKFKVGDIVVFSGDAKRYMARALILDEEKLNVLMKIVRTEAHGKIFVRELITNVPIVLLGDSHLNVTKIGSTFYESEFNFANPLKIAKYRMKNA